MRRMAELRADFSIADMAVAMSAALLAMKKSGWPPVVLAQARKADSFGESPGYCELIGVTPVVEAGWVICRSVPSLMLG